MSKLVQCEKAGECRIFFCKHKEPHFRAGADILPAEKFGSKVDRCISTGCHTRNKGYPIRCKEELSKPECIPVPQEEEG